MAPNPSEIESYPLPEIMVIKEQEEQQPDSNFLANVMDNSRFEDFEDGDVEFYYSSPEDLEDK